MKHKVILLGEAGVGKSTAGLSYPGIEMHVWGSTEESTIGGFPNRKDILTPVKMQWRECLNKKDKEDITKIKTTGDVLAQHRLIAPIENKARARNVGRYMDYLEELEEAVNSGKRPEVKAVFLDNWSPFSDDLWTYTQMLHADDYGEKEGFKLWGDYYNYCNKVLDLLNTINCHAIVSCHVSMGLDEEMASKVPFFKQGEASIAMKKDWQPFMISKYKFKLKSKFDYVVFMYTEESPGHPAKHMADFDSLGKARVNPFEKPNKIVLPKGTFYQFLEDALNAKKA